MPEEKAHPGSFYIPDDKERAKFDELAKKLFERIKEIDALPIEEQFIGSYRNFEAKDSFTQRAARLIEDSGVNPQVIYYPGCNVDLSFAKLFPKSRVIHADIDDKVMKKMTEGGYEAHTADMNEYIPDQPADVVVIFDAGYIPQEHLEKIMNPQGIVLVNNWHWAATYMRDNAPDFALNGVVEGGDPEKIIKDFSIQELGKMPEPDEIRFAPHSNDIFAFMRRV
jgi:hypothetical protein